MLLSSAAVLLLIKVENVGIICHILYPIFPCSLLVSYNLFSTAAVMFCNRRVAEFSVPVVYISGSLVLLNLPYVVFPTRHPLCLSLSEWNSRTEMWVHLNYCCVVTGSTSYGQRNNSVCVDTLGDNTNVFLIAQDSKHFF